MQWVVRMAFQGKWEQHAYNFWPSWAKVGTVLQEGRDIIVRREHGWDEVHTGFPFRFIPKTEEEKKIVGSDKNYCPWVTSIRLTKILVCDKREEEVT